MEEEFKNHQHNEAFKKLVEQQLQQRSGKI